jgi:hypothetical protein
LFSALDKGFDEAQHEDQDARSPTRINRERAFDCIGLAPMSPAPNQEFNHDPISPSDIDEKIKALGRDAAEHGFELLLVGTRDRISRLESDLAACDRKSGQREAAFTSTSAMWDTKRVAMETELGAYRTAVREALRIIEHHAGGKIPDVRNLLRGVHRS